MSIISPQVLEASLVTLEKEISFLEEEISVYKRYITIKNHHWEYFTKLSKYSGSISLNYALLFIAIKSYFDDIKRVKDYHKTKRANKYKIAAYTIKWLSKIKPLQIEKNDDVREHILHANELFALYVGLSTMDISIEDLFKLKCDDYDSEKSYLEHLMYMCTYRNISGRLFTYEMKLLKYIFDKHH